jgi:tRNA 2-thiouridine synthesizing protein A
VTGDGISAHLDTRGLVCPEPLLRVRKALDTLQPGERLEVLADDPVAPLDIAAFSHRTGNPLRENEKCAGYFRFVIEHK